MGNEQSFKVLLTLPMEFLGLVTLLKILFLEFGGRNYESIIIAIVSIITVLVSHSVLLFQYFIPTRLL